MRTYDVYRGQERQARVCVHEDGRTTWTYDAEGHDGSVRDDQAAIEQAIASWSHLYELSLAGFTVRRLPG